jgi:hypothetical protein
MLRSPATQLWLLDTPLSEVYNMIPNIAAARKRLGALLALPLLLAALALSPVVVAGHPTAAHSSGAALASTAQGQATPEMPGPNK